MITSLIYCVYKTCTPLIDQKLKSRTHVHIALVQLTPFQGSFPLQSSLSCPHLLTGVVQGQVRLQQCISMSFPENGVVLSTREIGYFVAMFDDNSDYGRFFSRAGGAQWTLCRAAPVQRSVKSERRRRISWLFFTYVVTSDHSYF